MRNFLNSILLFFTHHNLNRREKKLSVNSKILEKHNSCPNRLDISISFKIEQVELPDTHECSFLAINRAGKLRQINKNRTSKTNSTLVSIYNSPIEFEVLLSNIKNGNKQVKGIDWNQFLSDFFFLDVKIPYASIPTYAICKLTSTIVFDLSTQNEYPFSIIELILEYTTDGISWTALSESDMLPLYWINGSVATVEVFNGQYFNIMKGASLRFKMKKVLN